MLANYLIYTVRRNYKQWKNGQYLYAIGKLTEKRPLHEFISYSKAVQSP